MGKVKSYMMDIEEEVFSIDGIENKFSEAEHVSEVENFVIEELGYTSSFDIGIAKDVVGMQWNEYWGYYQC